MKSKEQMKNQKNVMEVMGREVLGVSYRARKGLRRD